MFREKRVVMITGAAGYVGEMLCAEFAKRDDVETVIGVDMLPATEFLRALPKLVYIEHNLAAPGWQAKVAQHQPDTVVHAAWQIRVLYGRPTYQHELNIGGAEAVFDFAFEHEFVQKLVHFGTAASYSARSTNRLTHYFTEAEGLRADAYLYAAEKTAAEAALEARFKSALARDGRTPQITVLRPAAITGPRGRFARVRFGLQSALAGKLGQNPLYRLVTLLTTFFPATPGFARQFIHEDDICDLVVACVTDKTATWSYEVFNATPTGAPLLAYDMAQIIHKKIIPLPPLLVRLVFWLAWHLTQGKISTAPHVWRFYSYPIVLSGEKLARFYRCRYSGYAAFAYTEGRYESEVPVLERVKPSAT